MFESLENLEEMATSNYQKLISVVESNPKHGSKQ